MPAGIVVGVVGYVLASGTDNPLDQRDAIIIALIGISVTLTGAALFVRYSLAEFLRFWMARLIHQQAEAGPVAAPAPAAAARGSEPPPAAG
jgi:drug/metabolite transporter (DMT)-like permease